eukprot:SM000050S17037  [mRNA]  locus=s50:542763:543211:- [translate_table: standard]
MATVGTARTPAGARMRNMFACCVHPRTHTATAGANNPLTGAMAGAQAGAARQRRRRQRDQSAYGVKTWFGRKKRDAAVAASSVTGGPAPRRRRFGIF